MLYSASIYNCVSQARKARQWPHTSGESNYNSVLQYVFIAWCFEALHTVFFMKVSWLNLKL